MYALIQQEPQNNDFLNFIRSLSNEQNLATLENIKHRIISELGYNSYFSDICKYITDNWKATELNEKFLSVVPLKDSSDEISQEDIDRGKYIIGAGLKMMRAAPTATAALNDTALWSKLAIAVHEWYMGMYDKAENYFNSFLQPSLKDIDNYMSTATDINHIYLGAGEDTFTRGVGIDIVDGGVSEDVEIDTNTIHLGGGND